MEQHTQVPRHNKLVSSQAMDSIFVEAIKPIGRSELEQVLAYFLALF
jgi:hypothetical protein